MIFKRCNDSVSLLHKTAFSSPDEIAKTKGCLVLVDTASALYNNRS